MSKKRERGKIAFQSEAGRQAPSKLGHKYLGIGLIGAIFLTLLLGYAFAYPPSPESGVSCWKNITINNGQSIPTPHNFQQQIYFNALANATTCTGATPNANLSNIKFFYQNGTIVRSWLENGTNTSTRAVFWLNITPSIPATSGSLVISIGFYPTSDNLMNGATIGRAPELSSTYGAQDNGADVFNMYLGCEGNSANGWTYGTGILTISNGCSTAPSGFTQVWNSSSIGSATIEDAFLTSKTSSTWDFFVSEQGGNCGAVGGSGTGIAGGDFGYGYCPGWGSSGVAVSIPSVWTTDYTGGYVYQNYTDKTSFPITPSSHFGLYEDAGITTFDWIRGRLAPPNGVMPSVAFSPIQLPALLQPPPSITTIGPAPNVNNESYGIGGILLDIFTVPLAGYILLILAWGISYMLSRRYFLAFLITTIVSYLLVRLQPVSLISIITAIALTSITMFIWIWDSRKK